ncbi:MAG: hypothetical protein IH851_07475 [Armatimonadetes bacterium]|nr:hypothetical protein [Armatimonadota bacterium]
MEIQGANNTYVLPELPPARNDFLDQEAFLRLLVVQLATQNPLEPMNDRDFFAQMAQLGMVQGIDRLQSSLQMSQAASLIGREVEVVSPLDGGQIIRGRVEAVETRNNMAFVVVDGVPYELDNVVRITA